MELKEQILDILCENALVSDKDISLMTGSSVEDVACAKAELTTDGIIIGYNAVLDWNKLDGAVQAVIEVRITPQRERGFDAVAQRIYSFDEVASVYLMSGGYDLMVVVNGDDMRHVALFVAEKLSTIEGVLSTATHFVLRKYKENGRKLIQDNSQSERPVIS